MTFHPVILCLVLCLGLSAATPAADAADARDTVALRPQGPRTSGPVSVSLQNEINAAIDRGRAWLLANQNSDGGWGSNSCVSLTALASLALAHDASPAGEVAVRKAGNWLLSLAATNTLVSGNIETQAWRELALQTIVPADPQRTADFLHRLQRRSATNGFSPFALMLIQEDVPSQFGFPSSSADTKAPCNTRILLDCVRGMPPEGVTAPSPAMIRILTRLAACWSGQDVPHSDRFAITRQYWVLAHFINRAGGGTLADGQGRVLDWRNDLARALVASQQIDATHQGNGFWRSNSAPADWASHPVAETAFALLALDEL